MIAIEQENSLLSVNVYGEMTLSDYKELEQAIIDTHKQAPRIKLLLDMTKMSGFTVDVAWEDIKFIGAHRQDFGRIAVVTDDQWLTWLSWLNGAFTDAEIEIFDSHEAAADWVHTT